MIFLIHLRPGVVFSPSTAITTRLHEGLPSLLCLPLHKQRADSILQPNITLEKETKLEKNEISLLSLEITTPKSK